MLDDVLKIVTDEETQKKIIPWLDKVKAKIKSLDDTIGLNNLSKKETEASYAEDKKRYEDTLKAFGAKDYLELKDKIKTIKTKKTEETVSDKYNLQLEEEIKILRKEKEDLEINNKQTILNSALERQMTLSADKYKLRSQAIPYVLERLKKIAVVEQDGSIVFQHEDKTPRRTEGRSTTVDDILREEYEQAVKDKNDMFYKIDPEPSGASNPTVQAGVVFGEKEIRWIPNNDKIGLIEGRE